MLQSSSSIPAESRVLGVASSAFHRSEESEAPSESCATSRRRCTTAQALHLVESSAGLAGCRHASKAADDGVRDTSPGATRGPGRALAAVSGDDIATPAPAVIAVGRNSDAARRRPSSPAGSVEPHKADAGSNRCKYVGGPTASWTRRCPFRPHQNANAWSAEPRSPVTGASMSPVAKRSSGPRRWLPASRMARARLVALHAAAAASQGGLITDCDFPTGDRAA